jgi:hypothetical protein
MNRLEYFHETETIEVIPLTAEEVAATEAKYAEFLAEKKAREDARIAQEEAKKAILEKLGLTEEEAKLLLS